MNLHRDCKLGRNCGVYKLEPCKHLPRHSIRILELGSAMGLYGAERWILALVKQLLASEAIAPEVGVIRDHPAQSAQLCKNAKAMGLPAAIFEAVSPFDVSVVRAIRNYVQKNSIEIIHTHGYKQDATALLATLGLNCKVISTPHGWTYAPNLKLRLYESMDRAIFPFLDAVVPLSKEMFDNLADSPWIRKKLHLINNAVDLEELNENYTIPQELFTWRSRGYFIVGFVGRLIYDKGIDTLLHAIAHTMDQEIALILIGEGPDKQQFMDLARSLRISERVVFLGYREDRLAFLKACELFVLPSLSEGLPRSVMEAMGLGITVVASDIPGCRTLVTDDVTGKLFTPGDHKGLAEIIDFLKQNPDKKKYLADSGRIHVQSNFSAKRMALEYENLFLRLAANTPCKLN